MIRPIREWKDKQPLECKYCKKRTEILDRKLAPKVLPKPWLVDIGFERNFMVICTLALVSVFLAGYLGDRGDLNAAGDGDEPC